MARILKRGGLRSQLLISFCNNLPPGYALALFDATTKDVVWLPQHSCMSKVWSVTGICKVQENYYYLALSDKIWVLCRLQPPHSYTAITYMGNVEAKDLHCITPYHNSFLVANSGRDNILKLTDQSQLVEWETFWEISNEKEDTQHINSVIEYEKNIYISKFGPKDDEVSGWTTAKNGCIVNITQNKVLSKGYDQPHSLHITVDNKLVWASSNESKIYCYDGNQVYCILALPGYLRGITDDENYFYVGASARRTKSKSGGDLNRKNTSLQSWLYIVDKRTKEYESVDMTFYGSEIYDLQIANDLEMPITDVPANVERYYKLLEKYRENL